MLITFDILNQFRDRFSFKAFLIGLGGVFAVYALLFLYVFLQSGTTIEGLEAQLSSHTALIEAAEHDSDIAADPAEMIIQEDHRAAPLHEIVPDIIPPSSDHEQTITALLHGSSSSASAPHALAEAPFEGFYEKNEFGLLPIKHKNGRSVFGAYQKPFLLNRNKHALAIAVLDYGLSEKLSDTILSELPSPVSLVLSPYSAAPEEWQKKARHDGHEIWLGLPVQTADFPLHDPGAQALLAEASLSYNEERLGWILGRTSGYVGLAGYTDIVLQHAAPMFNDVLGGALERGLGFLELNSDSPDFVPTLATKKHAPYVRGDAMVKIFQAEHNGALGLLEQHIQAHERTVLLVRPTPKNLKNLTAWIDKMERRGVIIAPVSAFAALSVER